MPNDPMRLLLDEHEVIKTTKDVIAAMEGVWTKSEVLYEEALRGLLSFFVRYSDGFHHRKEELALFPALKKHPDFYAHDLLEELEDHHATFRDHVAQMEAALAEKKCDAAQSRLALYFDQLLDHMAVESDELFVMAESLLSPAELERLYFRFLDIDRELGAEVKHDLEASPARLKAMAKG